MGPARPTRTGTTPVRRRRRRRRRRTGSRHGYGQTGLAGRVGRRLDPASPASAGRGVGMPRPDVSGCRAHRIVDRGAVRRTVADGSGAGGGSGGRCHRVLRIARGGGGPPVRPGNPGPVAPDDRPARAPPGRGARLHTLRSRPRPGRGAQTAAGPSPVGSGKPVGRRRREHRRRGWSGVRRRPRSAPVPRRSTRNRSPPNGSPRPARAGPATRRRRTAPGRCRWRSPR